MAEYESVDVKRLQRAFAEFVIVTDDVPTAMVAAMVSVV